MQTIIEVIMSISDDGEDSNIESAPSDLGAVGGVAAGVAVAEEEEAEKKRPPPPALLPSPDPTANSPSRDDGDDGDDGPHSERRPTTNGRRKRTIVRLTPRMIEDVGRARAASVLLRLRDGEDGAGIIAAMPSLVSLSGDFFRGDKGGGGGGGGGGMGNIRGGPAVDDRAVAAAAAMASMTATATATAAISTTTTTTR